MAGTIGEFPVLRGRAAYFKLTQTKGVLEDFDGRLRRKLRCMLVTTVETRLCPRDEPDESGGLQEERAWRSATNGRGPWWNSGAGHM
ncbi:MAG: group II intron maturase-specific domain-containing protein, partial [Desulfobulbaceae bacterium]